MLFIVNWQQSEGGWGYPDFDAEAYTDENKAQSRVEELNKQKRDHCGYYFTYFTAILKK